MAYEKPICCFISIATINKQCNSVKIITERLAWCLFTVCLQCFQIDIFCQVSSKIISHVLYNVVFDTGCPDPNCRYCHIETGACQGCKPGYRGNQCELGWSYLLFIDYQFFRQISAAFLFKVTNVICYKSSKSTYIYHINFIAIYML